MSGKPRVLVLAGYGPSLLNFRGDLIRAMKGSGADIWCAAPDIDDEISRQLTDIGVRHESLPLARNRIGPLGDLLYWRRVRELCKRVAPTLIFAYTVKPVIFGLTAARSARVSQRYALITGLGYVFTGSSLRRRVIRWVVCRLYRWALKDASVVFFQNRDDLELFTESVLVPGRRTEVVDGSGIDLARFSPMPLRASPLVFLMIARLLNDKGIREYVAAARRIRMHAPEVRFVLVGPTDPSPDAIALKEVEEWQREGVCEYRGGVADVRPAIAEASVYVLPSYREGMPRTVLEAMAMGRPVITTDVPGCRETVTDGVNGFLVQARDCESLVTAMMRFVEHPGIILQMGAESRRIASERFDVRKVNAQMLRAMGFSSERLVRD
jgi:glycosyltransferase involved in cell wall biosynthesis